MKRLLTEERIPGTSAVARFVGVEPYEAAGGKVLRDLFSNDDDSAVWFDDPALLNNLAMEKLRVFKDELETRWKWATAMVEVDWNTTARYGRIYPEPAERTPEEQAEIEKLEARQGVLAELDDDDWTEELVREAEAIEERLDEIEGAIEARAVTGKKTSRSPAASPPLPRTARSRSSRDWSPPRTCRNRRLPSPTAPERVTTVTTTAMPPGSEPTPAASAARPCPGP